MFQLFISIITHTMRRMKNVYGRQFEKNNYSARVKATKWPFSCNFFLAPIFRIFSVYECSLKLLVLAIWLKSAVLIRYRAGPGGHILIPYSLKGLNSTHFKLLNTKFYLERVISLGLKNVEHKYSRHVKFYVQEINT